jgi:hypothetical protein
MSEAAIEYDGNPLSPAQVMQTLGLADDPGPQVGDGQDLEKDEAAETVSDEISAPGNDDAVETEGKQDGDAPDAQKQEDGEHQEPVILAKDGKHTIPYSALEEARAEQQQWRQRAEEMQRRIDELQSQQQAAGADEQAASKAAIAEESIAEGVDPDLFGDFSEEAISKGVQTLVNQRVQAAVEAALKPIQDHAQQAQQRSATEAHYSAIYTAHPDADSIVESTEFSEWASAQPSYAQAAISGVLNGGTAEQINDVFSSFKAATSAPEPEPEPEQKDLKALAAKKVAEAKPPVPASLSDFPGGRAGGAGEFDGVAKQDPAQMAMTMMDWPPEKIQAFLNRRM